MTAGPEIITLGCRLNIAESEAMRAFAGSAQDLVIVNSCAVTNEAVRRTRQEIRKAKRRRPDARVIVTGCAAQIEPDDFAAMPEVSLVLGNVEKGKADYFEVSATDKGKIHVTDIMAVRETAPHLVTAFAERSRAFIEIQNGCDHRCTFCVIPFGRGNSRSVPAGQVIETIRGAVDGGTREVVLTGVDLTSYGADLPGAPSLGMLVERILRMVPHLARLRLSSLDPVEIDERLFALITGDERVMPYVHLSIQAGDNLVLKRMKRRHSRADAVGLVERLKAARPEIAIGADIIAGFPTEDEAMFANTLRLIDDCDIVYGHIFPYSPRTGTPAARMPQVDPKIAKARASRLRNASASRRIAWLESLIGSKQQVLAERGGHGHAGNFASVRLQDQQAGDIVSVRITQRDGETLIGIPA